MSDTDAERQQARWAAKWRSYCDECQGTNDPDCLFPDCPVGEDA